MNPKRIRGPIPYLPKDNPDPYHRERVPGERYWTPERPRKGNVAEQIRQYQSGCIPSAEDSQTTQLVTFYLSDSFPKKLRPQWEWLWKIEKERERRIQLEGYLDGGHGESHLRRSDVAQPIELTLRFYRTERYELKAWTIMPNHVHVLFKVNLTTTSLIVESWLDETNYTLQRRFCFQKPFWEKVFWHTSIRDEEHEALAIRYIESNATKAGLASTLAEWPWSSARFRDKSGKLHL